MGKKEVREVGLGEGVVLTLAEKLKGTNCFLYFDNFFSSPKLIAELYDMGIYGIGTVRSDRKNIPKWKADADMKRGDIDLHYRKKVIACKWYDNKAVRLVGSNVENVDNTNYIT